MAAQWKYIAPDPKPARPNGNWICKCGIGNHSYEEACVKCNKPYQEIPDEETDH